MAGEQPSRKQASGPLSTYPSRSAEEPMHNGLTRALSTFETIVSSYPPIVESLLLQLPTSSIINLYHTSECLRRFLQDYPTAWKYLSFRSLSPGRTSTRQNSPTSYISGDPSASSSNLHSLDLLLLNTVSPFGSRLKSLELDNTAVSGGNLAHCVLHTRRDTLQHLSVRGCKQVSLKYHIVPFLTLFKLQKSTLGPAKPSGLALESIYTYRCRHHRRRPYTPASRLRKDSDSAPTHDLIQLCHELDIWTDTGWCPTRGGRCLRRKDYSSGRATPEAKFEVWVVFDRLWRSKNRLGPSNDSVGYRCQESRGQLWENAEIGFDGEPLGCEQQGKGLAAHLRDSHLIFIENVSCYDCGIHIRERCEHCSIRMHCMGCRKTLCQDCAFSRPLPKVSNYDQQSSEYLWWAPDTMKNPNLMLQEITPSINPPNGISDSAVPPLIKTHWCCLRPMFSNGGSVNFLGSVRTSSINHIRAAPLPKGKGYEDPEFVYPQNNEGAPDAPADGQTSIQTSLPRKSEELLQSLSQIPNSEGLDSCSRNLCKECWRMPEWKHACQFCKEAFCIAHDLRGLKIRLCGRKDLALEKAILWERSKWRDILGTWEKTINSDSLSQDEAEASFRKYLKIQAVSSDSLKTLEAVIPFIKWPLATGDALNKEIDDLISQKRLGKPPEITIPYSDQENANLKDPNSPFSESDTLAKPEIKKWEGCGAFMCQKHRAVGDHRNKCTAAAQQCMLCMVHVCPDCLASNPPCNCSYCKDHYRCPNCFPLYPEVCRKKEEEEEKRRQEEKLERERLEALRVIEEADGIASLVEEFMSMVDDDASDRAQAGSEPADVRDIDSSCGDEDLEWPSEEFLRMV